MVTVASGTPALGFCSSCTVPRIAPLMFDCARIGDMVAEANKKNSVAIKAKISESFLFWSKSEQQTFGHSTAEVAEVRGERIVLPPLCVPLRPLRLNDLYQCCAV